jgi:tetratricopeptide (TPR) repeat protein
MASAERSGGSSGERREAAANRRLRGWKEIAAWAGVDERTVKRWEHARGLPVHRVPGEARAPVFAFEAELAAWLRAAGDAAAEPAAPPAGPLREMPLPEMPLPEIPLHAPPAARQHRRWLWFALGIGLAGLLLLFFWPPPPPRALALPATPAGRALWTEGEYAMSTRTRDGIALANARFAALAAREPDFAPGLARLAVSYNLLAQFDLMPAGQAYARAVTQAERALDLEPRLPLALAARGFARFYGARDIAGAMADLKAAAALPDAGAEPHQWLALVSMHSGRQRLALAEIARAEVIDPKSRAILANHGLILMHAGRLAEAERLLTGLLRLDPALTAPMLHLASLYLATGRGADHAAMLARLAQVRRNPVQALQARALADAFARGGMPALLATRRDQMDIGNSFALAGAEAMLGHNDVALAHLDAVLASDDPHSIAILVDLPLASLRRDPRFAARAARAGFTPEMVAVLAGER